MSVRLLTGGLGVCGLLISVFFALVSRGVVSPESRLLPKICRMEESSCVSILDSSDARLFGVQNFYPGIVYYGLVLFWVFWGISIPLFLLSLKIASTATVIAGVYLTFSLIFKLKVSCILCFAGHIINLLLFTFFFFV